MNYDGRSMPLNQSQLLDGEMRGPGDFAKRIYDRFVGDMCRKTDNLLDSRGPRRALKIRISARGSKTARNGSADYGVGSADSDRSAPQSRCRNIFATGAGVSYSRLATDTRAIGDTRRQLGRDEENEKPGPSTEWEAQERSPCCLYHSSGLHDIGEGG